MRALLAVTVATVLLAASGASAAPPSNATHLCGPHSSGFKSWISIATRNLSCPHAVQLGVHWSDSCARPKAGKTETCHPSQLFGTHPRTAQYVTFTCTSHGHSGPAHYSVDCTAPLHRVTFTFFPHGF